jgi:hypothetical protein
VRVAHTLILATQEAEIRRTKVQGWPRQIVLKTLSQKNPSQKRAGGVAQGTLSSNPVPKKKKNEGWLCCSVAMLQVLDH